MRRWQAEWQGVDRDGGPTARRAAPQRAVAAGGVGIPFLAVRSRVPLHEIIEQIVGERGADRIICATGDVAPVVVAAGVDRAAQIATGGADRVETGQLVRGRAVTVQVLVVAGAVERSLPELAQVRVGVADVVACATHATGKGATATSADARRGLGAGIACPHQPVLFIVTEVLRLAAAGAVLPRHGCKRRAEARDIAHGIIAATLAEDRAGRAAATLPGGARSDRTQIAIVGEVIVGKRGAGGRLEIDVADIALRIIAQ